MEFFHTPIQGTWKRSAFWEEESLLCLLSLISETGEKFAAHVKKEERDCTAEDKLSHSMKSLLSVSSGLTTMWNLFHDMLDKSSLETIPEMNIHLKIKRKETQSVPLKSEPLSPKSIHCLAKNQNLAIVPRICKCDFVWA